MNAEHERAWLLRLRVPGADVRIPWRTHGLLLRATLFLLAGLGVVALHFFLDAIRIPEPELLAGLTALLVGELLIRRARWFWTGVEEALWLAGMIALVSALPPSSVHEGLLVFAAAVAVAGARVRNPLFGAMAAGTVVAYCEEKWDLGVVAALLLAAAGVIGLLRTWRRPSNEWLCIAVALVLPLVGRMFADEVWRNVTIILYGAFGLLAFFLAVRRRHHALFLAAAVGLAIAGIEIGRLVAAPLELKLAAAGASLLAGSWLVSRALRDRTTGFVTTPAKLTSFDDDLELAATIAIPQQDFEQKTESGGKFGGAGATGRY